jgi:putative tryptophan/tyrosine transport system substrate-binding protein
MRRRDFLALFAGTAATLPVAARAAGKIARVGLLTLSAPAEMISRLAAFRDGMHELGYLEGQNVVFEARFAEGRVDRLTALTAQLLQANVDVIVTSGHPAIRALQLASSTTPIVAAIMSDPVEEGFAVSYARPGGNITGLAFQDAELITKRLEDSKRGCSVAFARCRALGSRNACELIEGDGINSGRPGINPDGTAGRKLDGDRQGIRCRRKQGAGPV